MSGVYRTVSTCYKPKINQQIYNEHERLDALKYHSATTLSGMIADLFGSI